MPKGQEVSLPTTFKVVKSKEALPTNRKGKETSEAYTKLLDYVSKCQDDTPYMIGGLDDEAVREGFARSIRRAGNSLGKGVQVVINGDSVMFQLGTKRVVNRMTKEQKAAKEAEEAAAAAAAPAAS